MLSSTEKLSPDLPFPCEISQLRSKVSINERVSENNNLLQLELDLFNSALDDNIHPLPKFSIRDYVSSRRGKDIRTNWPFSQKNLQLCLKHRVTDVLPPFQSLGSVRSPLRVKCVAENTIDNADVRLPGSSNLLLSAHSNSVDEHLAVKFDSINSSGSQEDNDFQSSKIWAYPKINSVKSIESQLEPEAVNMPRFFVEKPESEKLDRNIQKPVKSCKLIVKLNKVAAVPVVNEHLSLNSSAVSETMASKVCPVCSMFSSSSNTTLNAHIDQCLSGVSTIEWTANTKVSKHRIKPRKTKFVVDIYAKARKCTLEDLDRRNGTKWSSNVDFQNEDLEECVGDKNIVSACGIKSNEDEGAVYVDSRGTKFLSLTKFSELPSNYNGKDDCRTRRLVKRNKESKFSSSKKTDILAKKRKLLTQNHCPEENYCQQRKLFQKGYMEEDTVQPVKACDQLKFDELGKIKLWVGSKRTDMEKINLERGKHLQHSKIVKNLRVKDTPSARGGSCIKSPRDSNSPVFSNDKASISPFEWHKRKEKSLHNPHDECIKQPSIKKRAGLFSFDSQECDGKRNYLASSTNSNMKWSRKEGPSIYEHHSYHQNDTENYGLFHCNNIKEINTSPALNSDCASSKSRKYHQHSFSSAGKELEMSEQQFVGCITSPGGKKFLSMKKKSSAVYASIHNNLEAKSRKHLTFKMPRLHYSSESDEEVVVPRSALRRQDDKVEKHIANAAQIGKDSGQPYTKRTSVLKLRKEKGVFMKSGKEVSKGSETSSESNSQGVRKINDSCMSGGISPSKSNFLDAVKEVNIEDEFPSKPICERTDGEAIVAFSKSLDSAFHRLSGPSEIQCNVQHYIEKSSDKHYTAKILLGGESELFLADEVENVARLDSHAVAELDTDEGRGNYFVDVDPIPIPGPPGSFLPSPGRMSSEELEGNSSLTTCRIPSSEENHELVDMDSSDSPISSASMVPESAAARFDSPPAVNLSGHSHGISQKNPCNSSEERIDPVLESSHCSEAKGYIDGPRNDFHLPEMTSPRFTGNQPCCCSRKEGTLPSDSLNYQESRLLRLPTITSVSFPAQEKQMSGDLNEKAQHFNLRPETLPEKEPAPTFVSHNPNTESPACSDSEFPSPSMSNPILRLMGKNLMVMSKDENLPPRTMSTQLHPRLLSNVYNGGSTARFPYEQRFINHTLSQSPLVFDHVLARQVPSNGFETTGINRIQGLSSHPERVMVSSNSFGGGFTSPLERHEYVGGCNSTADFGSKIGMDCLMINDIEKIRTSVPLLIQTADFTGCKHKEVIVINDSLKSEPGLAIRETGGEAMIDARGSSVGISSSVASELGSRYANPFFSNQARGGYPLCNGSQVVHTNFQVPSSKGMDTNSVKWSCGLKGSTVLHPNSQTVSSPSTGHLRSSSLYSSTGFS